MRGNATLKLKLAVLAIVISVGILAVAGYHRKLVREQELTQYASLKASFDYPDTTIDRNNPRMRESVDINDLFSSLSSSQRQAILDGKAARIKALPKRTHSLAQQFLNDRAVNCKAQPYSLADDALLSVKYVVRHRIYHLPTGNLPKTVPCLEVHITSGGADYCYTLS